MGDAGRGLHHFSFSCGWRPGEKALTRKHMAQHEAHSIETWSGGQAERDHREQPARQQPPARQAIPVRGHILHVAAVLTLHVHRHNDLCKWWQG